MDRGPRNRDGRPVDPVPFVVAGAYHRFVRRATPDAVGDAVTRSVWGR